MKKYITVFFLLSSLITQAQFNKGDKFVGGSISASTYRATNDPGDQVSKRKSLSLAPSLGYFINKNFAIGVTAGYSTTHYFEENVTYKNDQTLNSVSAGIFAKRFFTLSDKFLFGLNASATYGRGGFATFNWTLS